MTTDERITSDLAIVARTSRAKPIVVADTLHAVGAVPADARPAMNVSPLALLQLSRVYVARIARTYAGVAAIACVLALLGWLQLGDEVHDSGFDELAWMSKSWVALLMLATVICTYGFAARIAYGSFMSSMRRAADPLDRACRLTSRAVGWATASAIAGTMAFLLFFGMMQVALGSVHLDEIRPNGMYGYLGDAEMVRHLTVADLLAALAASGIAAFVVARAWQRERRWMIPLGFLVLVVTVLVGLRLDTGPIPELRGVVEERMPSALLRSILTATGTAGLLLIVSAVALGIRRREDALVTAVTGDAGSPTG